MTSRPAEAKIRQPQDFDGSRLKARKFLQDCKVYLGLNSHIYDTDEKKISFTLSFCTAGTAEAFAENYYSLGQHTTKKWSEFESDFTKAFLSSDLEGEALQELKNLTQSGSADEYIAKFKILATRAGMTDYKALKDYFQQGLSAGLRARIYNLNDLPKDMDEWYKQTQKLDNQWRQLGTYATPSTSTRPPFPRRDFIRNRPPVVETSTRIRSLETEEFLSQLADDVYAARLSITERDRYFKENRCFRCGTIGHMARSCTANPRPEARSVTRTNRSTTVKKNIRSLHQDEESQGFDFEDISLEDRTQYIRGLLTGIDDDDYNQIVDAIQESENFRED